MTSTYNKGQFNIHSSQIEGCEGVIEEEMADVDVEYEQDDSEDESPENKPSLHASKNLPEVITYKKP